MDKQQFYTALQWGAPLGLIGLVALGIEPGWVAILGLSGLGWWARGQRQAGIVRQNMQRYIRSGGLSRPPRVVRLQEPRP